jgi:hypothetical protein
MSSKKERSDKNENPLFYMENGLIVFTEAYHLARGFCCNSGCRHCPFKQRRDQGSLSSKEER